MTNLKGRRTDNDILEVINCRLYGTSVSSITMAKVDVHEIISPRKGGLIRRGGDKVVVRPVRQRPFIPKMKVLVSNLRIEGGKVSF